MVQTPERRPRVLVADDDPDIRDLVAFKLTQAGFDVDLRRRRARGLGRVRRLAAGPDRCST